MDASQIFAISSALKKCIYSLWSNIRVIRVTRYENRHYKTPLSNPASCPNQPSLTKAASQQPTKGWITAEEQALRTDGRADFPTM